MYFLYRNVLNPLSIFKLLFVFSLLNYKTSLDVLGFCFGLLVSWFCYIAQTDLELNILLPRPFKSSALPCQATKPLIEELICKFPFSFFFIGLSFYFLDSILLSIKFFFKFHFMKSNFFFIFKMALVLLLDQSCHGYLKYGCYLQLWEILNRTKGDELAEIWEKLNSLWYSWSSELISLDAFLHWGLITYHHLHLCLTRNLSQGVSCPQIILTTTDP